MEAKARECYQAVAQRASAAEMHLARMLQSGGIRVPQPPPVPGFPQLRGAPAYAQQPGPPAPASPPRPATAPQPQLAATAAPQTPLGSLLYQPPPAPPPSPSDGRSVASEPMQDQPANAPPTAKELLAQFRLQQQLGGSPRGKGQAAANGTGGAHRLPPQAAVPGQQQQKPHAAAQQLAKQPLWPAGQRKQPLGHQQQPQAPPQISSWSDALAPPPPQGEAPRPTPARIL